MSYHSIFVTVGPLSIIAEHRFASVTIKQLRRKHNTRGYSCLHTLQTMGITQSKQIWSLGTLCIKFQRPLGPYRIDKLIQWSTACHSMACQLVLKLNCFVISVNACNSSQI